MMSAGMLFGLAATLVDVHPDVVVPVVSVSRSFAPAPSPDGGPPPWPWLAGLADMPEGAHASAAHASAPSPRAIHLPSLWFGRCRRNDAGLDPGRRPPTMTFAGMRRDDALSLPHCPT